MARYFASSSSDNTNSRCCTPVSNFTLGICSITFHSHPKCRSLRSICNSRLMLDTIPVTADGQCVRKFSLRDEDRLKANRAEQMPAVVAHHFGSRAKSYASRRKRGLSLRQELFFCEFAKCWCLLLLSNSHFTLGQAGTVCRLDPMGWERHWSRSLAPGVRKENRMLEQNPKR